MNRRPSKRHTLERIDNDGPYAPDNCEWATRATQMRNTRKNHRVTFDGDTLCVMDWSNRTGIKYSTLSNRLLRGWTVKRALTEPIHRR